MRYGRQKALHTARTMRSALAMARALDPLGPAPLASNDYVAAVERQTPWGMLGNDRYGNCVKCDDAHRIMLRTANTGNIVIPTEAQVLADYLAQTGGQDAGLVETDDCQWMMTTGMLGHKSSATGTVDPHNIEHVKWGVQLFGGCRLGIGVSQEMEDQFAAGLPWTATDMSGEVQLHDVPMVLYDGSDLPFHVITWGGRQRMSLPCFLACCANLVVDGVHEGEVHVEAFPDWLRSQGTAPPGLDMPGLEADLRAVAA